MRTNSRTNGVADPAQDSNVCISAEELSDLGSYFAPVLEDVKADCRKSRQPTSDPNRIEYRMSCSSPDIAVTATTQASVKSAAQFSITMVIDSRTKSQTGHVEASIQANRVGPCD